MSGRMVAQDRKAAISALDELFAATQQYRTSDRYLELLRFIRRFPRYAPFNCFLLHMQRPSVSYVAPAAHWRKEFRRTIRDGARPLVILQPFGPVLFVFDAADTEGDPLRNDMIDPYATHGELPEPIWETTLVNISRDRIALIEKEMPHGSAGRIGPAHVTDYVLQDDDGQRAYYRLEINSVLDRGGKYATLAHELGHLYAGHLGTPDPRWWPDRRNVTREQCEFEAESICYLVCGRAGVNNPSEAYLSHYLGEHSQVLNISLDAVLKVAGAIEEMGRQKLKPRKQPS